MPLRTSQSLPDRHAGRKLLVELPHHRQAELVVSGPQVGDYGASSRREERADETGDAFLLLQRSASGVAGRERHQVCGEPKPEDLPRLKQPIIVTARTNEQRSLRRELRTGNAVHCEVDDAGTAATVAA